MNFIHLPMKMDPIVSSETSAIKSQTPGNYPKRNKLHLQHGESLRTRYIEMFLTQWYAFHWLHVTVCRIGRRFLKIQDSIKSNQGRSQKPETRLLISSCMYIGPYIIVIVEE